MWNTLKKINAQDSLHNKQLKEQVSIDLKLLNIASQKKAQLDRENVARAESVKKQQQMLNMMSVGKEGAGYDKLTAKMAKYHTQLKKGTILTNDQVRALRLLEKQTNKANKGSS